MRVVLDHLRELLRYRALVEALVRRELKARYRGSVLGYFWTFLNPLLLLIVYRLVFTKFTRAVEVQNYAVFFFVGILPWLWLSSSLTGGSTSISQGGALITRVCMPPQVLPTVLVLSNLVNFVLALPIAIGAALVYGIPVGPTLALVPLTIVLQLLFVYGLTVAAAALTVRFRDIQFIVANLVPVWFFITPIAYPTTQPEGIYRTILWGNPATPLVTLYQDAIYGGAWPEAWRLALAAGWAVLALVIGIRIFEARRDLLAEEV